MRSLFSNRILIGAVMLGATTFAATTINYRLLNTYKFGAAPGEREHFDYITLRCRLAALVPDARKRSARRKRRHGRRSGKDFRA